MSLLDAWKIIGEPSGDFQARLRGALTRTAIAIANEVANDSQTITITGTPTGGTATVNKL